MHAPSYHSYLPSLITHTHTSHHSPPSPSRLILSSHNLLYLILSYLIISSYYHINSSSHITTSSHHSLIFWLSLSTRRISYHFINSPYLVLTYHHLIVSYHLSFLTVIVNAGMPRTVKEKYSSSLYLIKPFDIKVTIHTSCQPTLSTHPIHKTYHPSLPTHPVNSPCQHTL